MKLFLTQICAFSTFAHVKVDSVLWMFCECLQVKQMQACFIMWGCALEWMSSFLHDCCQKWPCIQSQDMHSIYYSTSLYIQFVSNQIQLKVCNTIICLSFIFFSSFLSQMSHYCLCTVRPIVYVDKNTVYSIVFINIITNKNHLQKT